MYNADGGGKGGRKSFVTHSALISLRCSFAVVDWHVPPPPPPQE